uniref:50S ribosomal protein L9, chloroplastic n=1 Tax=Rhodochaete parvula TaxID=110510 RepID=A0A1X9PV20_9RHOD|nr:50S ribosomal protein L9 [Rhodochaete parvula]ASK39569.1 ribosomal protein L9 [Rhodochaete parvula]
MAKKTISVLILNKTAKFSNPGSIENVPLGYARNFLIPQGLACLVTPSIEKKVQQNLINKEKKEKEILKEADNKAKIINSIKLFTIKKKVGKDNLIFGSVTTQEIAELVKKISKQTIDKKNIELPTIKLIGTYSIKLKLHQNIYSNINLQLIPEHD